MAVIKVVFILLFTLATFHVSNCQLAGIATSLPPIISLMDNLTDISPYMPQLAALLKDQNAKQLITNRILQNNTAVADETLSLLPGIMSLMQGQHSEILNTLLSHQGKQDQIISLLENQQETQNETAGTLVQMAATQSQMASSQEETTNSLSDIASTQNQMATTQSQMATTQSQMASTMNQMVSLLQKHDQQLENITAALTSQNQILSTVASLLQRQNDRINPQDCTDVHVQGYNDKYGTYTIKPDNLVSFQVSCDLQTEGGGWTVFQRRFDGSVDFYRGWEDYKNGFGDLDGEHWLGLENIHRLTSSSNEVWQLRIELEDFYGNTSYAQYDNFVIGDETTYYRLGLGAYSGTAGNSLGYNANRPFSTYDQDHDIGSNNCAQYRHGAWWYWNCTSSNLNGLYVGSPEINYQGMWWWHWKSSWEALKKAEMKMRRM